MTKQNEKAPEKIAVEEAWLLYFNNYLFEHRLINEDKRNRMVSEITARLQNKASRANCNDHIDFLNKK